MNLFGLLNEIANRLADHGAIYSGTECFATFAQLKTRSLSIAGVLQRQHVRGDRIAIVSENRPDYIEFLFGIWAAGLVAVPINAKLHVREIADIVLDCGASRIVVSPKLAGDLEPAPESALAASTRLTVVSGDEHVAMARAAPAQPADVAPDDLAWLFYTSGTTGRSKGAMLSHRNLLAMTIAHLADIESADETMSLVHGAPMSHGSGLYILPYLARGARQVIPASGSFDAAEFLDLCDRHPGCCSFLAPTMVQRLRAEAERSGRRPTHLQTIVYGGGPMYVEELKRSIATFGPIFAQIYGQGESPMTITGLRKRDHQSMEPMVLGSVGWPRSGMQVQVVDPGGRPLPAGEAGEVVCRGDVVCRGYWNNKRATADTLRDGWLYTGDVGVFHARGFLTLRDRSKDVVISGGSNIYPREVEEALLTHSGVSEVSIVGRPDREWGEVVVAFIVREQGASVSEAALDAHCMTQIARFKRPRSYIFIDALPKNNYGKVLKRELRARLSESIGV